MTGMPIDKYELLDKGYTAIVYRIPGTQNVCKSFPETSAKTHFLAEKEAYERFTARGHPATILKYFGVDDQVPFGIVLELAPKGTLYDYIRFNHRNPPLRKTLHRWARQAAEALAFSHSCGVLHSDIHCVNFLLDENLDLKVADFAGASIDGGKSWSTYRLTHRLFGPNGNDNKKITVASEIFAFGSALHYMVRGHDIFPELHYEQNREEIIQRLRERKLPPTNPLSALGNVIRKCWALEYEAMVNIVEDIDADNSLVLA